MKTDEKLDREMEMKYRQLSIKPIWKIISSLPLPEDDEGCGLVEFTMSLDQAFKESTNQSLSWAPGW